MDLFDDWEIIESMQTIENQKQPVDHGNKLIANLLSLCDVSVHFITTKDAPSF